MRKIFPIILSVLLCAVVLAACGPMVNSSRESATQGNSGGTEGGGGSGDGGGSGGGETGSSGPFSNGIVFNYVASSAGTVSTAYPSGALSVNMIEIVRRPGAVTYQKYQANPYSSTTQPSAAQEGSVTFDPDKPFGIGDPGKHAESAGTGSRLPLGWDNFRKISGPGVKGDAAEKGWIGDGDYEKGTTGWCWQDNPMDERPLYFGGTAESWIKGNLRGEYKALQTASGGIYAGFTYIKDKQIYVNNYFGEAEPYFVGAYDLTKPEGGPASSSDSSYRGSLGAGEFVRDSNGDNKLNINGEQYWIPALPTDDGVLWLRVRMDYKPSNEYGYQWKGAGVGNSCEWFAFNPATAYAKDSRGNIVIDIDVKAPYMSYRK